MRPDPWQDSHCTPVSSASSEEGSIVWQLLHVASRCCTFERRANASACPERCQSLSSLSWQVPTRSAPIISGDAAARPAVSKIAAGETASVRTKKSAARARMRLEAYPGTLHSQAIDFGLLFP